MAPRRRQQLRSPQRRQVSGAANRRNKEKDGRKEELQLLSAAPPSAEDLSFSSEDPDLSMSVEELDEDDLLDDENEFQKDMEMQRREDMKNGHFGGDEPSQCRLPDFSPLSGGGLDDEGDGRLHSLEEIQATKVQFCNRMEEVASHLSLPNKKKTLLLLPSSTEQHFATETAGRPARVMQRVAVYESTLAPAPTDRNLARTAQDEADMSENSSACSPTPPSLLHEIKRCVGKGNVGVNHGKDVVLHATFAAESHPQIQEDKPQAFNVVNDHQHAATNSPTASVISAAAAHLAADFAADFAGSKEIIELEDHASHANKLQPMREVLLQPTNVMEHDGPAASDHHHTKSHLPNASHSSHLGSPNLGQPTSSQLNISAQPKPHTNPIHNAMQTPQSVSSPMTGTSLHHLQTHPTDASQPPSHISHNTSNSHSLPVQRKNKPKFTKANSNPKTVDLTAALFSGTPKPASLSEDKLGEPPNKEDFMIIENMSDFPPLHSPAQFKGGNRGSSCMNETDQAACSDGPREAVGDVPHPPTLIPSRTPWAKPREGSGYQEDNIEILAQNVPPEALNFSADGREPTRSMAETLRKGVSAEGPIYLDRDTAEKRGEVRIVEGKPCLFFSANETSILAGRLGPAIVGKFSHSIPPAHQIQKALGNIKLLGEITWNFLNAKHIFIRLSNMRDYVKLLNGPNNSPVWYIEHHPMRVFKWTPDFDPFFESPITTVWCNILALPVHLFEESALIAIGELLGTPVQVDRATITRSRVSFARICVEVDLSRPIVDEIDINIAGKQVTLKVKWDKIPLYCSDCKHVGHSARTCYASGKRPMPPKRDYTQGPPPPQSRPPGGTPPAQPRQEPRTPTVPAASRGQHPPSRQQAQGNNASDCPSTSGGHPHLPKGHMHVALDHGALPSPVEESKAAHNDGFSIPANKRKPKSKAARKRDRERRRARKQGKSSAAMTASDEEEERCAEAEEFSSESDRGPRSLSPSHRSGSHVGPLAMVLHDSNMFGALQDDPSDDNEVIDEPQDLTMAEANIRQICLARPAISYLERGGPSSPPQGGIPKRARRTASTSH